MWLQKRQVSAPVSRCMHAYAPMRERMRLYMHNVCFDGLTTPQHTLTTVTSRILSKIKQTASSWGSMQIGTRRMF